MPIWRIRVAGLTYDDEGNVVNWGQPNSEHLLRSCRSVPCWRVLYVSAWVRDFPGVQGPHRGDQGWWYYVSFYVARWDAVPMFLMNSLPLLAGIRGPPSALKPFYGRVRKAGTLRINFSHEAMLEGRRQEVSNGRGYKTASHARKRK